MKAQLSKSFSYTFVLNSEELRRIHDTMVDQMKRVTGGSFECMFKLRYKNDTLTELSSLDEVLREENSGAKAIQFLEITLKDTRQADSDTGLSLKFTAEKKNTIAFTIYGNDREWVAITGSQLEENIRRVRNRYRLLSNSDIDILIHGLASISLIYFILYIVRSENIIAQIIFIACILLIAYSIYLTSYIIPKYNFCWGSYVEKVFKRRQRLLYIVLGVIVSTIIAVIGGIIANRLFSFK